MQSVWVIECFTRELEILKPFFFRHFSQILFWLS